MDIRAQKAMKTSISDTSHGKRSVEMLKIALLSQKCLPSQFFAGRQPPMDICDQNAVKISVSDTFIENVARKR